MDAETISLQNAATRVNVFLASVILFLQGTLNSLGVLTSAIEAAGISEGQLRGVWTSALSLIPLVSTPLMVLTGFVISGGKVPVDVGRLPFAESKTDRVRILAILGSLSYGAMSFVALATENSNRFYIKCGAAILGIASGVQYILAIEVLAAWAPQNAGLAIGMGIMANGCGAIVSSAVLGMSSEIFGYAYSLHLLAILLTLPSLACSLHIAWPPASFSYISSGKQRDFEAQHRAVPFSFQELSSFPCFGLYFVSVFSAQATYAFLPGFFEIGSSLKVSRPNLVGWFQTSIIICTLMRPVGGYLADILKWGHGRFSVGSKNAMSIYLSLQAILFFSMISASTSGYLNYMKIAMGAMFILFSLSATCVRILARDIFGPENSCLAFGVGGCLGLGLGEYLSMSLLSWVSGSDAGPNTGGSSCNFFYLICGVWSLLGLASCAAIERCEVKVNLSGLEEIGNWEMISSEESQFLTPTFNIAESFSYGSMLTKRGALTPGIQRHSEQAEISTIVPSSNYLAAIEVQD